MPSIPESCGPFEADLSALIDGELRPEREAAVRAHVAVCPLCSERLQALCDVDLELAAATVLEVPADLRARLADRIAHDESAVAAAPAVARGAPPPRRRRWLANPVGVAVAAAAALAILYLVVGVREPGAPTVTSRPIPSASRIVAARALSSDAEVFGAANEEDLAVVLELETVEHLDIIANFDLLQRWLRMQDGAAG
jgi:anti-sigma factor RsiW